MKVLLPYASPRIVLGDPMLCADQLIPSVEVRIMPFWPAATNALFAYTTLVRSTPTDVGPLPDPLVERPPARREGDRAEDNEDEEKHARFHKSRGRGRALSVLNNPGRTPVRILRIAPKVIGNGPERLDGRVGKGGSRTSE